MAVSIDDMQIDVSDAASQAATPAPAGKPQESGDLRTALDIVRERELRLRAD